MVILNTRRAAADSRRVSGQTRIPSCVRAWPHADTRILGGRRAEKLIGAHAKRGRESRDVVEGKPALAGLDATEGGDIHADLFCDLLESEPTLGAKLPQPAADARID